MEVRGADGVLCAFVLHVYLDRVYFLQRRLSESSCIPGSLFNPPLPDKTANHIGAR